MAKGSAGEVKNHLFVTLDQGYIKSEIFDQLMGNVTEITCLIGGLMAYLKKSGLKGTKIKDPRSKLTGYSEEQNDLKIPLTPFSKGGT